MESENKEDCAEAETDTLLYVIQGWEVWETKICAGNVVLN